MYEDCRSGTAAELIAHFEANEPKGEMVLMIAPSGEELPVDIDVEALLREKMAETSLKSAVKSLVETYGLNKNEVYELALRIKNEQR